MSRIVMGSGCDRCMTSPAKQACLAGLAAFVPRRVCARRVCARRVCARRAPTQKRPGQPPPLPVAMFSLADFPDEPVRNLSSRLRGLPCELRQGSGAMPCREVEKRVMTLGRRARSVLLANPPKWFAPGCCAGLPVLRAGARRAAHAYSFPRGIPGWGSRGN